MCRKGVFDLYDPMPNAQCTNCRIGQGGKQCGRCESERGRGAKGRKMKEGEEREVKEEGHKCYEGETRGE